VELSVIAKIPLPRSQCCDQEETTKTTNKQPCLYKKRKKTASQWRCLSLLTTLFLGCSVATEKKQQKQQINSRAFIKKQKHKNSQLVEVSVIADDPLPRSQRCDRDYNNNSK